MNAKKSSWVRGSRSTIAALACLAQVAGYAVAESPASSFDGRWDTVLTCSNSHGALGYVFDFVATVDHGRLHGEHGKKGERGWLTIDGEIGPDGSADLLAKGLVGAAPYAVGARPAGTEYAYHIEAHFVGQSGNGHRIEGRPCSVTFAREH